MRTVVVSLAAVFMIGTFACRTDPHRIVITEENRNSVVSDLRDFEERMTLTAYLGRQEELEAQIRNGEMLLDEEQLEEWRRLANPVGKTVGEALQIEEHWQQGERDQRRREKDIEYARQVKRENLEIEVKKRISEMRELLHLQVIRKTYNFDSKRREYIDIELQYVNTTYRKIRAFRGVVRYFDVFNLPIYDQYIMQDDPLEAGETGSGVWRIDYEDQAPEKTKLLNTQVKNMTVVWQPTMIVFDDGDVLEVDRTVLAQMNESGG